MKRNNIFWFKIIFTIAGAVGGFIYWKLIGCASGTCMIKSVWYYSTLWGATMGYLLGDLTGSFLLKNKTENDQKV
jgi:hypothetical protein